MIIQHVARRNELKSRISLQNREGCEEGLIIAKATTVKNALFVTFQNGHNEADL